MKYFTLFIFLLFLTISCDETNIPVPPNVVITEPNQEMVSGIVKISAMANSIAGLSHLELWVNGKIVEGSQDYSEPYEFEWNTLDYDNNSRHSIIIRAIDVNENITDSEIRYLTVDNSGLMPDDLTLTVSYEENSAVLSWNQSQDENFSTYELFVSNNFEMNDPELIFSSNDIEETTYLITDLNEGEVRYYQLKQLNNYDLESVSNIVKVELIDDWEYVYSFNNNDNTLVRIGRIGNIIESQIIDSNVAYQARLVFHNSQLYYTPNKRELKTYDNGLIQKIIDYPNAGNGSGFHGLASLNGNLFIHLEASGPQQGKLSSLSGGIFTEYEGNSGNSSILAITEFNGKLYAYSESSNSLYIYDENTGRISNSKTNSGLSSVQGMDSYGNFIYAIDNVGGSSENAKTKFYKLDLVNNSNELLFTLNGSYSGLAFVK